METDNSNYLNVILINKIIKSEAILVYLKNFK